MRSLGLLLFLVIGAVAGPFVGSIATTEAAGTLCTLPATGEATGYGPGSDGDVRAGAPLSYTDNGDGTITDNNTGLMWEKKDDSGGIHDKDNTYTWSTGTNHMNGTIVTNFLAALNGGGGFAGYSDWRIPNTTELVSILSLNGGSPLVDPVFHQAGTCTGCSDVTLATCSCTAGEISGASWYWSSTTAPHSFPGAAQTLDFQTAEPGGRGKVDIRGHVRAVRSIPGAPCVLPATGQTTALGSGSDGDVRAGAALSYTDNGDGTITDNNTGLMWEKKDDSGGIHDKANPYTWSTGTSDMDGTVATVFLASLNAGSGFAGHSDWRIPNYKELMSILDFDEYSPAVNVAFHRPGSCTGCTDVTQVTCSCTFEGATWSSTTSPSDPSGGLGINIFDGSLGGAGKAAGRFIRAVRDSSCGNGTLEAAEQCDDGNKTSGDGCDRNCTFTGCGNGIVTAGEACDDGNANNSDACLTTCIANVCGDGLVHSGVEECDDGNLVDGDGCDANCTPTGCGNGVVTADEQCDDGNTISCDGCSATCATEPPLVCGDGILDAACGEQCEDGNQTDGDGCDSNCTFTACGNGVVTAGEQCDDGNLTNSDGCEADCTLSACAAGLPGVASWWRGDGNALDSIGGHHGTPRGAVTYVPGRVGSAFHFNGASWIDVPDSPELTLGSNPFTIELWARFDQIQGRDPFIGHDNGGGGENKWIFWYDASGHRAPGGPALRLHINSPTLGALDPTVAPWSPATGRWYHVAITRSGSAYVLYIDGVQAIAETDSHVIPDPRVPLTIGRAEGYLFKGAIDEVTLYNRALTPEEIAAIASAGALGKCGNCGNGVLDPGEQCDDGNTTSGDGCDANCTITACGNGIVTAGEVCDDGNASNSDACLTTCVLNICGDGFLQRGVEECDDGNNLDSDSCDSNCTRTVCGNGVLTSGEQCDDGNLVNGDGCDANCTVTACGNGILTGGEECDDGNGTSGDNCDSDCRRSCGNGLVDGNPLETCDDGNRIDGDGCDSNCTPTGCGNGIVTAGEECDDGNLLTGDYCDANCSLVCLAAPAGLVAWWPGNGNAHDVVAGRNGTVVGGATYAGGKVGDAFHFAAANLVEVPDDPIWTLGSNEFTIELWVDFDRIQGRDPFIGHDENGGELNKWIFWYDAAGHRAPGGPALRFHINSPTLGPLDPVVYPWSPVPGQWYHVAVTRGGATYALYINGAQVITEQDTHVIPDPSVPLTIGKAEAYLFAGLIDEVGIYNRALIPTEIQNIYGSGVIGKCSPCGNRSVDPNEQCDDGNAIAGDGCEANCTFTPEAVTATAGAGGTITTDSEADGATPTDPVETSVRVPNGGSVTISEDPGVASVGFAFFAHRIDIIAAPATPEAPLVIAFRIDASQLPGNTDLSTIEVFKDGASVPPCVATDASAAPDPCVASRALAGDGDVEITVLTSTASAWSFGLCGNNVVEAGEQCDDGNQVDGDGCSRCSLDVSRLVPGSRAQITCALEWLVPGNLSPDGHGVPRGVVECTDDDPSCDFGAVQGDQACTFRVAMCFNVVDARLTCAVSNVRYLRLVQPSLNSKDPSDVSNRAALGKAPTQLGGTVEGVCANSSALSVASCALNSACNSGPGKRDGKCRRFIDFDPSLAASLQCSEFASIRVPLKRAGFGKGTRKLQLTALPEGSPVLGPALNADADSVKLVCKPRLQ